MTARKAAVTTAKAPTKPDQQNTTATFETIIVAHTSRLNYATELANRTSARIELDNGRLGCTRNHLAAWTQHQATTTSDWALVIEDDAVPIDDFTDQAGMALAAATTPAVSFYLGKQRPPQHQPSISAAVSDAADNDNAWITASRVYHAVAIAIHTDHVAEFLRIAMQGHRSSLDIDEMLTEWLHYYGHSIAYTQPSLVDHRDEQTIAKHRDSAPRPAGRKAWRVGTREDWNTAATVIP